MDTKKEKIIIIVVLAIIVLLIIGIIGYLYIISNKNKPIQTSSNIAIDNTFPMIEGTIDNKEIVHMPLESIIVVLNEKKYNEVEIIKDELQQQENNTNMQEQQNNQTEKTTQESIQEDSVINEETPQISNQTADKYYIKVNYQENIVNIYSANENGEYIPHKTMLCSTGTATPTSGSYKLDNKYRWLGLVGGVYGQYCSQITGNILFHSVPYTEKGNKASLEYWEYDKLGTSCSAGCVRLTVADAKWIYENCKKGTVIEFYASDDVGPLGKPEAIKISDYIDYRGWDPTDEDENNPWINFAEI